MKKKKIDELYEKALELYDDDEISEAKKLFRESFQNGNMDSAYMLGIMYLDAYMDLGFKKQPVHEAKRYFEAGAKKGHKECKRELAIILTKEQEYDKAIINFLESGDYSKEEICKDNLDPMLRMKKCDELVDCESIINYLDTINSKCDREDIKAVIIRNISRYIKLYDDRFLYKVNNEDEFLQKSDFYNKTIIKYEEKIANYYNSLKQIIQLSDSNIVKCEELIDRIGIIKPLSIRYIIYRNIVDSYLYGDNNGTKKNGKKALYYFNKLDSSYLHNNYEYLKVQLSNLLIEERDYENALMLIDNKRETIYNTIREKIFNKIMVEDYNLDKFKVTYIIEYANKFYERKEYEESLHLYKLVEDRIKNTSFGLEKTKVKNMIYVIERKIEDEENINLQNIIYHNNGLNVRVVSEKELPRNYATWRYEKINTLDCPNITSKGNYIYYLYSYYPSSCLDSASAKKNFYTFMEVKNEKYLYFDSNRHACNFPVALSNAFAKIDGDWIICTVPGHEKTDNYDNGVHKILCYMKSKNMLNGFELENRIIKRLYTVPEKKWGSGRSADDYIYDMKSLGIGMPNCVIGKNIIVIDDITTTGSSLIACRTLLLDSGAKQVIVMALGNTIRHG